MAKVSWTSIVGAVILLATVFLIYHTFDDSYQVSILTAGRGPVFFPRIILGTMLFFSVIVIIEGFGEKHQPDGDGQMWSILAVIGLAGLYIWMITVAGFLLSTVVFTALLPPLLGYRKWRVVLIITAIYPISIWYIFEKIFLIILPSSPWFEMF